MTRELNRYFKDIDKKLLILSGKQRMAILQELRGNVSSFLQENPNATVKDVEAYFGSPVQVAEGFLQAGDFQQTERKVHINRRVLTVLCIAIGVLVTAALILGTVYVVDNYKFTHGYWEKSPPQYGPSESDPDALYTY